MTPEEHRLAGHWVTLTTEELLQARDYGQRLHDESVASGRRDRLEMPQLESSIVGAVGEYLAAKFYGFPFPTAIKQFGKPDLGLDIGVRCRTKWWYQDKIAPEDRDDFWFVLVSLMSLETGDGVVRGFYGGKAAKEHPEWIKEHGGYRKAWFVPDEVLIPPEQLSKYSITPIPRKFGWKNWRDDPAAFKLVRVNRHYWIDPGTNYQLAHLIVGPMPTGPHEADAVCEAPPNKPLLWPLVGEGVVSVPLHRACARCIDLMPQKDVVM